MLLDQLITLDGRLTKKKNQIWKFGILKKKKILDSGRFDPFLYHSFKIISKSILFTVRALTQLNLVKSVCVCGQLRRIRLRSEQTSRTKMRMKNERI